MKIKIYKRENTKEKHKYEENQIKSNAIIYVYTYQTMTSLFVILQF